MHKKVHRGVLNHFAQQEKKRQQEQERVEKERMKLLMVRDK